MSNIDEIEKAILRELRGGPRTYEALADAPEVREQAKKFFQKMDTETQQKLAGPAAVAIMCAGELEKRRLVVRADDMQGRGPHMLQLAEAAAATGVAPLPEDQYRVALPDGRVIVHKEKPVLIEEKDLELSALRARIADLEAQLEAVGAGGVQRMVPDPMDHFKAAHQLIAALLRVEPSFCLHKEQTKGVLLARLKHDGVEYDIHMKKSPPMTDDAHPPMADETFHSLATAAPDPADFPLGKACDLSGEGNCEACQ